jgi:hypothetical protein
MPGKTKTLYLKEGETEIAKEAAKLAAFYESKSLGDLLIERCKEVIAKYSAKN